MNNINPVFLAHLSLFFKEEIRLDSRAIEDLKDKNTVKELEQWFEKWAEELYESTTYGESIGELNDKIDELKDEVNELKGENHFLQKLMDGPFAGMIDNMKFQVFKENKDKFTLEEFEQLMQ